jgi:hypothetical protein
MRAIKNSNHSTSHSLRGLNQIARGFSMMRTHGSGIFYVAYISSMSAIKMQKFSLSACNALLMVPLDNYDY